MEEISQNLLVKISREFIINLRVLLNWNSLINGLNHKTSLFRNLRGNLSDWIGWRTRPIIYLSNVSSNRLLVNLNRLRTLTSVRALGAEIKVQKKNRMKNRFKESRLCTVGRQDLDKGGPTATRLLLKESRVVLRTTSSGSAFQLLTTLGKMTFYSSGGNNTGGCNSSCIDFKCIVSYGS